MEKEKNPVPINVIPPVHYVGGAQLVHGEEEFVLALISGNQMFRFAFSPKHAKRLALLLEKQLGEYEVKFGVLETQLPDAPKVTSEKKKIGFDAEE